MDLIADHISHRFGTLEVLDDVSFTVGAGEVVAYMVGDQVHVSLLHLFEHYVLVRHARACPGP